MGYREAEGPLAIPGGTNSRNGDRIFVSDVKPGWPPQRGPRAKAIEGNPFAVENQRKLGEGNEERCSAAADPLSGAVSGGGGGVGEREDAVVGVGDSPVRPSLSFHLEQKRDIRALHHNLRSVEPERVQKQVAVGNLGRVFFRREPAGRGRHGGGGVQNLLPVAGPPSPPRISPPTK
ncbi:MAG: hypothetical protein BJ554DRAFT_7914, partial [Olpidium bornovanus]